MPPRSIDTIIGGMALVMGKASIAETMKNAVNSVEIMSRNNAVFLAVLCFILKFPSVINWLFINLVYKLRVRPAAVAGSQAR